MTQMMTAPQKIATVRSLLEKSKAQIQLALPKHMSADRMLRIAVTSVQRVPRLLDCDPISLVAAVIQSAQLGLEPDGALGHAYLIPYKNTVTFQPGYRGLLELARRSGEIGAVEARVVYAKDQFVYRYGLDPDLRHVPSQEEDPGPMAFVYAVVRLKDGGVQWEVMSRAQIEAHRRKYSRATGTDTPWQTAPEEMAKKTVLKRALKLAPASVELQQALAHDEHVDAGLPPVSDLIADALAETPETVKPSRLEALTATLPPPEPPAEVEVPDDTSAASNGAPSPNDGPQEAFKEVDGERQALLYDISQAMAAWGKPASPALWTAIQREVAGVDDIQDPDVDVVVLGDLLTFARAVHKGERPALLRLSEISKTLVKAARLPQQRSLEEP